MDFHRTAAALALTPAPLPRGEGTENSAHRSSLLASPFRERPRDSAGEGIPYISPNTPLLASPSRERPRDSAGEGVPRVSEVEGR